MVKDYRRQIVDYFKKNLGKGYTADALKFSLMNQGYSRAVIDVSLEKAQLEMAASAPILKEKPVIRHSIIDDKNNVIEVKKRKWWRIFSW